MPTLRKCWYYLIRIMMWRATQTKQQTKYCFLSKPPRPNMRTNTIPTTEHCCKFGAHCTSSGLFLSGGPVDRGAGGGGHRQVIAAIEQHEVTLYFVL